jgi:hypothetical protein
MDCTNLHINWRLLEIIIIQSYIKKYIYKNILIGDDHNPDTIKWGVSLSSSSMGIA